MQGRDAARCIRPRVGSLDPCGDAGADVQHPAARWLAMLFPVRLALALWCIAEVLVFVLVVKLVGFGLAMLASLAASVLGFALLRRTGAAALVKLRASFRGRLAGANGGVVVDGLAVLGALALLLPGFLSDLVGLALIVPPVRARAAAWLAREGARMLRGRAGIRAAQPGPGGDVVDLEPKDWRRTDRRSPGEGGL